MAGRGGDARRGSNIQSRRNTRRARPWLIVGHPGDKNFESVYRITLDIPRSDADFLHRYADYRNALAKVLGERLKRVWTRKTLGEALFEKKISDEIKELREMVEACGEIPPPGDSDAMIAYAKKVVAWTERRTAETIKAK